MLGCSCLQWCRHNLVSRIYQENQGLCSPCHQPEKRDDPMEVLIIPFKWDFPDNVLLENDGFSMGRKTLWGSSNLK